MPFVPLGDRLPELARRETRTVTVFRVGDLPMDEYGFLELYCDEPSCDCRRVFLNVVSRNRARSEAVIAYGWEDADFYARWLRDDDPQMVAELQGPVLNLGSPASELAPALLRLFTELLLSDRRYLERLKRHYQAFRAQIEARPRHALHCGSGGSAAPAPTPTPRTAKKIRRNDPCPCASGRKYKVCCGSSAAVLSAMAVGPDWSWRGDVELIVEKASLAVGHIVRLGALLLFSTRTGDAWLLDTEDRTALPLAQGRGRLRSRIFEAATTFAVEWTHDYEVQDNLFIVCERTSGRVRSIDGYGAELLAAIEET